MEKSWVGFDPDAENKQHKAKIKRVGVNTEMLLT